MDVRKQLILTLCGAVTALLLMFTFFSNTIFTLHIPAVVVGSAQSGITSSRIRAEGFVDFTNSTIMYAENSGRINFEVQVGDRVEPGDLMFTINMDVEDILDRLDSYNNRLHRVSLNKERIQTDLSFAQTRLANLSPDEVLTRTLPEPDMLHFDHEAARLDREIELAEEQYQSQLLLYNAGVVSRAEFDLVVQNLESLQSARERINYERSQILAAHQRNAAAASEELRVTRDQRQRAFQSERSGLEQSIMTLRNTLELLTVEEDEIHRSMEQLNEQLYTGGILEGRAEYTAVIQNLMGLRNGMLVDRNHTIMDMGLLEDELYSVVVYFPEAFTEFSNNVSVHVDIPHANRFGIEGTIQRSNHYRGRIRQEIAFETSIDLRGGERVVVIAEYFSQLFDNVLPNSAIRESADGTFVLYVERESLGLMRYAYYARRMDVNVIQQGDRYSAIRMAAHGVGPIILQADQALMPDERIRLAAER